MKIQNAQKSANSPTLNPFKKKLAQRAEKKYQKLLTLAEDDAKKFYFGIMLGLFLNETILMPPQENVITNKTVIKKHLWHWKANPSVSNDYSFQKACSNGSPNRRATNFRLWLVLRKCPWRNKAARIEETRQARKNQRKKCCLIFIPSTIFYPASFLFQKSFSFAIFSPFPGQSIVYKIYLINKVTYETAFRKEIESNVLMKIERWFQIVFKVCSIREPMFEVYVIRHGQSEANKAKIHQGTKFSALFSPSISFINLRR